MVPMNSPFLDPQVMNLLVPFNYLQETLIKKFTHS